MGKLIGQSLPLYDGPSHVSGKTRYTDDVYLPGMLYVAAATIPAHHARILNIDTSAAERVTGVAAVLTHKDVKNNYWGGFVQDQPVLPDTHVRHWRQPVAAVAAVDEDTAWEAAQKIVIDYEELPAIFDPEEAMKPGALQVHEGGNQAPFGGYDPIMVRLGDVEKGLKESDHVIEHRYVCSVGEHCQMEPHCSVAQPNLDGSLILYTTAQTTSFHQGIVSGILGIPLSKLRLISWPLGGGFGSKNSPHTEMVASFLALKTGKPVKWRWNREDEFTISTTRCADTMYYTTGFMKDGTLTARKVLYIHDTGAFNDFGTYGMLKLTPLFSGPYKVPNIWFDAHTVYTNKMASGPLRGYPVTQSIPMVEMQMDEIARITGLDPAEVRLKNMIKDGDMLPTRQVVEAVGATDTLKAVLAASGWNKGGK